MPQDKPSIRVLALVPDAFGGHGGIALYLSDLIEATASLDQVREVRVLARNAMPEAAPLPDKVTVQRVRSGRPAMVAGLVVLLKQESNFDLIICGHINFLPLATVAKKVTGARLLLMIYGIDAWNPVGGWLGRRLIGQRMKIASISHHTRELFCRWSGRAEAEIAILPNAIHSERYGPAPPDAALKARYGIDTRHVILTLGRLSAQERYKGIDELLDVLPELLERIPNAVFVIAGDGDDVPRLRRLVKDRGLQDFVRFTGRVSEEEKAAHYQMADVFAMPGRGEGFGFVFLEAMACGVPVVASKLDGSREAVRNGEIGLLVDPDSKPELLDALTQAFAMPKQVPEGLAYFSFDRFVSRLRATYADMGVILV